MRYAVVGAVVGVLAAVLVGQPVFAASGQRPHAQLSKATAHVASGRRGPRGFRGPRGPAGFAAITEVKSGKFTLAPGQSNVNTSDDATCPRGWIVVGTGFDDGGVMTVGFVESFHTFVDGFIYNGSSISAQYEWQAICARSGSASVASVSPGPQRLHAMKLAALRQLQRR
jgi:hypothetical protein